MTTLTLPDVTLAPMLPVLLTLLGAVAATVLGFFVPRRTVAIISLLTLALSAVSMGTLWDRGLSAFGGSLQADNAAIALGMVLLLGSAIAVLVSLDTAGRARLNFPEFDAVLMFAVTGTLVIAFSGDLVTMLIGLEVMSLSGYVLATLQDSRESEEAGVKYFLLGATGSAILIYGIALVYGATGSLNYAGIAGAASGLAVQNGPLLVAGALLLLCGFGFKVALAPFHQWTPDVYGGSPTVVSLFLSTVVKVAAFAGMLRVFSGALHNAPAWLDVLAVLTAVTLVVGNLAALFQTNFKRLLAYSAVAQTGFLALTLLGRPETGGPALAYYLLVYTLTTAAALAIVAALQRTEAGLEISDMRGLYYRHPGYAAALSICLASLAGLPPFAGFMAKYMAFQAAFQNGYAWVAVVAALTSIAAFVYYMRVAALLFLPDRTPAREYPGTRTATTFSVALGVVGVTVLGILPNLAYAWVAYPGIWTSLAGT
ncbi:NADH-quinone oxidoreductase subunit N [Deinococcus aquiradiocola]|uniref:NADH-quinone oxidoreductase subunit N n=1 Tax=Deinococcus aquiradiocola TaxID=393059 RepID=A0A917P5D9_9DEIO|nr:NADH-quinone oxidoreductase subunit N [Deinococcus aquiradiocola]GGJ62458.1 NADH-quinone oxidoreductase subunit N [Deinococcus aquiradiocola]